VSSYSNKDRCAEFKALRTSLRLIHFLSKCGSSGWHRPADLAHACGCAPNRLSNEATHGNRINHSALDSAEIWHDHSPIWRHWWRRVCRRRARGRLRGTAPFTWLISGIAAAVTDGIGHVGEQICARHYCDNDSRSCAVNQRHRCGHLPRISCL